MSLWTSLLRRSPAERTSLFVRAKPLDLFSLLVARPRWDFGCALPCVDTESEDAWSMVGDLIAVVDTLSVSSRVVSEEGGDNLTRNMVGMLTVFEGIECLLGQA